MGCDPSRADEDEADDKSNGGEGIQEGIQGGKKREMGALDVGRRMKVNQPEKEKAGDGADGDDRPD